MIGLIWGEIGLLGLGVYGWWSLKTLVKATDEKIREAVEKNLKDYQSGIDEKMKRLESDLGKEAFSHKLEQEKRFQFVGAFSIATHVLSKSYNGMRGSIAFERPDEFKKELKNYTKAFSECNAIFSNHKAYLDKVIVDRIEMLLGSIPFMLTPLLGTVSTFDEGIDDAKRKELDRIRKYINFIIDLIENYTRIATKDFDPALDQLIFEEVASDLGLDPVKAIELLKNMEPKGDYLEELKKFVMKPKGSYLED
ncbi:hypothetical protein [Geothrix sp. 21YS21S-2]|uniref:hypothetical protein n=1 Tax=Geothrix sp. 21YS21S-2 TaxID=3068893 RepID=UPI0027B92FC1|nr:hypothetical protein [Geothrix sp. 21YS21S-2]